MFIQACLNGSRRPDYHPRLPTTLQTIVRDAIEVVEAGAAEIHVHPRGPDGRESLAAVDETIAAVRSACPGTLIGVSTGAWIESDEKRTRQAISAWETQPDHATVNLSENDAPAIMELLADKGIGIEAGLASVEDAKRFVGLPLHNRVLRVLIELDNERQFDQAAVVCDGILEVLRQASVSRPMLLHGFDATVWPFVERARQLRLSTRVGLEDGKYLPDGSGAGSNAEIVAAAVAIFKP